MSAGPAAAEWLPEATLNGCPSVTAMDWRSRLIRSKTTKDGPGAPKALLAKAITALREAPEWKGALSFNEFSLSTVLVRFAPWDGAIGIEWTDHEDRLTARLVTTSEYLRPSRSCWPSRSNRRARVQLPSSTGIPELAEVGRRQAHRGWLSLYLGSEPTEYTAAVGARWSGKNFLAWCESG